MAIDKLKIMLSFMREINDGNIPKSADYGITNEELWGIVEACQDEGLIKGATHAGRVLFFDTTKLTVKGMEYLHQNKLLFLNARAETFGNFPISTN